MTSSVKPRFIGDSFLASSPIFVKQRELHDKACSLVMHLIKILMRGRMLSSKRGQVAHPADVSAQNPHGICKGYLLIFFDKFKDISQNGHNQNSGKNCLSSITLKEGVFSLKDRALKFRPDFCKGIIYDFDNIGIVFDFFR